MDGLTLYREMRKCSASTVGMIISAFASAETRSEALAAGAWKVLPKPVDFSQLLPLIDRASHEPLVLVVDDDRELCENLWSLLRDRGFRVCVAHSKAETEQQMCGRDFQVVLIDVKLPDTNGQEIFDLVQKHVPEAHTVVITGFRGEAEEPVQQLLKSGADAVCYKPFDVPMLLETVSRLAQSGRDAHEQTP
jgi:DNA-binding response OmpR family regulator